MELDKHEGHEPGNEAELPEGARVLVRIGKCGGTSLRRALVDGGVNGLHVFHVKKPPYREDLSYIIVARDPVARALSAFNWRYRLVVTEEQQKDRFAGEHDVLSRYGSMRVLAEALFDEDGSPNEEAQSDYCRIHHLREGIAYHLEEILARCRPQQVKAVLMQESLDQDIERVFGIHSTYQEKRNTSGLRVSEQLGNVGLTNLRRYLEPEYRCLLRLSCFGKLDPSPWIGYLGFKEF